MSEVYDVCEENRLALRRARCVTVDDLASPPEAGYRLMGIDDDDLAEVLDQARADGLTVYRLSHCQGGRTRLMPWVWVPEAWND